MVALFLRPDADQSDGSWLNEAASNTNLFNSVDESSFSDTDFIKSSSTSGDKVRLRLSDPGATVTAPMIVRYRCKKDGSATANVIGRLFQGTAPGTQIATWTQLLTTTFTTYTYTLTSPEFSSISDFNDLYVEFEYSTDWWLSGASVDLWFQGGVYYDSGAGGTGQAVTTYLSCSRASTGFAKTSAGALTSFGANALRLTDLGLLCEEARTNLILQSADFTTTWNNALNTGGTVTADQAVAPDGTTTMDKLNDGTGTGSHFVYQQITTGYTANVNHAFSIFAKDIDRRYLQILFGATGLAYLMADLQTGTITETGTKGSGATFVSANIEAYANSVYRLILIGNSGNAETGAYFEVCLSNSSSSIGVQEPNYTGSNKSLYVWGAQVEDNVSFASSYMPTTTGTFARAADNITTSSTLQSVINNATASLVVQTDNGGGAGFAANIVDSNGTNLLGFNASNNGLASITATLATGNTGNRTTADKLGLAWNASGRSLVLNGGTVATDATAQTPSATQHIGSSGSANFANAYIERLTAFNTKLANATLQGFTV